MRLRTAAILVLTSLSLGALACNLSRATQGETPSPQAEMTLAEALEVAPEDARPEVLRLMGIPDSITITWQELEGQPVRLEEWSYYDSETRFDFVDGELAWTVDIPAAPDGSLFAHQYDPLDFASTLTLGEVKAMLADQTLVEGSLAEADAPGGLALIGDQILLGFDGGRLVFVQTFILSPDGSTAAEPPGVSTLDPLAATLAPDTPVPAALLIDDFEGAAQPLFGTGFMTFTEQSGEGVLTSYSASGVVPVMCDEPVLADFALEVDVRFPQAQSTSIAGIVFRSDDAAGGLDYYYQFAFLPTERKVNLDLRKDGQWSTLATAPIPDGVVVPGAIDRLRVEADGSQLRLRVNGTSLLEANDDSLTAPGVVGLSLVAAQTSDSVFFDNLRLQAIDE